METVWQEYGSEAYANDVKCMYNSASGEIVVCSEFVWDIYIDIVV